MEPTVLPYWNRRRDPVPDYSVEQHAEDCSDFVVDKSPKTFIVLGAPRSGTSFVSKSLAAAGVNMNALPPFYEDQGIRELNKRIIARAGGTPENPPTTEALEDSCSFYSGQIQSLLDTRRRGEFWGWKDVRQCLTFGSFLPHLSDDVYIVAVFRKPKRVAASMLHWGHAEAGSEVELAKFYQEEVLRSIQLFLGSDTL